MPLFRKMIPDWMKAPARNLVWKYRQVTSHRRVLPGLILIGAQKAGTSSLYTYLAQHPQFIAPYRKEVHFFDGGLDPSVNNFNKGLPWYKAHFPLKKSVSENSMTFEASPLYIFNPLVPERMFDVLPGVKIIVVLRNPTERAISHYYHKKRTGLETLPIKEALQKEEERLESAIANKDYKSNAFIQHSYKSRGLYRQQLERFFNYYSRQQLLILTAEELFGEPENTLRRIFDFSGVDSEFKVNDMKARNVASNKDEVDSDVYEYLNEYFYPHNQELYELVGKNYGW